MDNLNSGIYAITCRENGRIYVGSTINFDARRQSHWSDLNCGLHRNRALQEDFRRYGAESFDFSILERHQDDLKQHECRAMMRYDAEKLYNIRRPTRTPMVSMLELDAVLADW